MTENQSDRQSDRIFIRRTLIAVATIVVATLIILLVWRTYEILLMVFGGILLAIILRSLSAYLERKTGLPHGWSILIVILVLLGISVGGIWLLSPSVDDQIDRLAETIPRSVDNLKEQISHYEWGAWLLQRLPNESEITGEGSSLLARVGGFFSSTFGILANLLVVTVVGIYLAIHPGPYKNGFIRLFPKKDRARAREVINEILFTLKWWLVGQFAAMTVIGVLTTITLWLLGVPLALTLGVVAGLLTFVPTIGPIVSVVPAALLAMMVGPATLIWVVVLYAVIQNVESYLITPNIQKKAVLLPPAVTIVAEFLFGIIFGLPGLIFATPLTAVLIVFVKMVYVQDILGDNKVVVPSEMHSD